VPARGADGGVGSPFAGFGLAACAGDRPPPPAVVAAGRAGEHLLGGSVRLRPPRVGDQAWGSGLDPDRVRRLPDRPLPGEQRPQGRLSAPLRVAPHRAGPDPTTVGERTREHRRGTAAVRIRELHEPDPTTQISTSRGGRCRCRRGGRPEMATNHGHAVDAARYGALSRPSPSEEPPPPLQDERAEALGKPTCASANGPSRWSSNSTKTACTTDGRDSPWGVEGGAGARSDWGAGIRARFQPVPNSPLTTLHRRRRMWALRQESLEEGGSQFLPV
jgi:hypothetical protein